MGVNDWSQAQFAEIPAPFPGYLAGVKQGSPVALARISPREVRKACWPTSDPGSSRKCFVLFLFKE